ncbi:MAG: c-type cytochrome, partial [Myxococcales bacterium]|nr:c-type cytochrome [Myxococcales bacterium]
SVAVEAADGGEIVWWRRETASLFIDRGAPEPRRIDAGGDACADAGHTLFHTDAGAGIACASCHPEGGDDGHVWQFDDALRRTPSLRGGLIGAAPYHWEGDLPDFGALVEEVFEHRMGGPSLPADWRDAFLGWLDTLAEPEADLGLDAAAVARGEQVFNDETVGCTECHAGALLSDRKAHDVGTGGPFITPRLAGLGLRGPYLHDGCAPTLADRFTACGGGEEHGRTAHLSADQRADLIAWLRAR